MEMAKATITRSEGVITIEGSQEFVDEQVAKYMTNNVSSHTETHSHLAPQEEDVKSNAQMSEKQFVLSKKPKGHPQTVAVLAFALTESGKPEFSEEDIRKAYIRAGVRPPKVVSQAIRDAKNRFEYIEVGSERGLYKLSHHGDRTVRFDFPEKTRSNG